jgi:hypothetical protein
MTGKKAKKRRLPDDSDDEVQMVLPEPSDVDRAREVPPVRDVHVSQLDWDEHCEHGQIRDLNYELAHHYLARFRSQPPPVRLMRGVVYNTGGVSLAPCPVLPVSIRDRYWAHPSLSAVR